MTLLLDWILSQLTIANGRQLVAIAVVIAVALGLRLLGNRLWQRLDAWWHTLPVSKSLPWAPGLAKWLSQAVLPLALWLLFWASVGVFDQLGWERNILRWLAPLAGIWLLYSLVSEALLSRLSASASGVWIKQVLRPVTFLLALLYALGLIDDILAAGIRFQETRITIGTLLGGILVLVVFLILSSGSRRYLSRSFLPDAGLEPALTQALSAIVAYLIVVTGFVAALDVVGLDLTTLTVIAGGLSVGIGFGLQEIISNFLSGFILLFERSIGPGDVVEVSGSTGRVEDVGIRSTRIQTNDNVDLIVPNSNFLSNVVKNFTRSDIRVRVDIAVGVSYRSDPRQVEAALLRAADHPQVLTSPSTKVEFAGFGESSLDFNLQVWTNDPLRVRPFSSQIRFRIWDELKAAGIEIPFPQRDIHIRSLDDMNTLSKAEEISKDDAS